MVSHRIYSERGHGYRQAVRFLFSSLCYLLRLRHCISQLALSVERNMWTPRDRFCVFPFVEKLLYNIYLINWVEQDRRSLPKKPASCPLVRAERQLASIMMTFSTTNPQQLLAWQISSYPSSSWYQFGISPIHCLKNVCRAVRPIVRVERLSMGKLEDKTFLFSLKSEPVLINVWLSRHIKSVQVIKTDNHSLKGLQLLQKNKRTSETHSIGTLQRHPLPQVRTC